MFIFHFACFSLMCWDKYSDIKPTTRIFFQICIFLQVLICRMCVNVWSEHGGANLNLCNSLHRANFDPSTWKQWVCIAVRLYLNIWHESNLNKATMQHFLLVDVTLNCMLNRIVFILKRHFTPKHNINVEKQQPICRVKIILNNSGHQ